MDHGRKPAGEDQGGQGDPLGLMLLEAKDQPEQGQQDDAPPFAGRA
jgi:hypothetical protein